MARGATLVTDTVAVTGSFSKLQAAGTGSASGGNVQFANITFGLPGKESYGTVFNDVGPLVVSSSQYVEGPIISFKLVDGQCLAYTL